MRFQVVRIRAARKSEIGERARLRREVVTYYEGYLDRVWCILLRVMLSTRSLQVGQHCAGLESKLTDHGEKTSAVLVREEVRWYIVLYWAVLAVQVTLEQHRRDLSQLCAQIEKILAVARS